ncbi:uncharacterized protein BDR25DRAFT_362329 [Lindgomyces ingoldianus]|uniref:Uncharacterized protein n=1 Tax=Lindgomyces ingoldianus TaxID=673940 RepID=A0ACB6QAE3_9PLEO|nr:uncharacterized protein BDR25DRAFT_362329 [Lindgomyces ingoldianus]KAF2463899.1 hypothetical protein BDR25DRAFT_362329 [Lindgomyces ingoldianus]
MDMGGYWNENLAKPLNQPYKCRRRYTIDTASRQKSGSPSHQHQNARCTRQSTTTHATMQRRSFGQEISANC